MSELTQAEKAYNAWWMSRFDADHYKTIRLINHGKVIQLYTTLSARYSDEEDAECAFLTALQSGEQVSCVAVGNKRYKKIKGKIQRIANLEVRDETN